MTAQSNKIQLHPEMGEVQDKQFEFDRNWFKAHPDCQAMMRRPFPGEAEIGIASLAATESIDLWEYHAFVKHGVVAVIELVPQLRNRRFGWKAIPGTQIPITDKDLPQGMGISLSDSFYDNAMVTIGQSLNSNFFKTKRNRKQPKGFG